MLGGADNPNGELPSYITGADTYDGGQLLTIFEIKLNGANFLFFSKHVSSPECPGNRPHPLTVKHRGVDSIRLCSLRP